MKLGTFQFIIGDYNLQHKSNSHVAKYKQKKDPHHQREAQKYEHPVPSREFILTQIEHSVRPLSFNRLLKIFDIHRDEEKTGLRRRLRAMQRDGQIMRNRRGDYGLVKEMDLIAGRVQGHRDGYGFLIPDEGGPDVFLPARQMREVFSNDRVLVRTTGLDGRGRREGVIVEVLERNTQRVVGRYFEEGGAAFVNPDDKSISQDIIIPADQSMNARHGQFVVVEILLQPSLRRQPTGKIIEILGDQLTPGMEVELAIRSHDLPFIWPKTVNAQAKTFPKQLLAEDYQDRMDLREYRFVTIDGEDARDFDDAVYCEQYRGGGWKAFVAIADVSHYVMLDTPLDKEAYLRGNSVYFPSKVIPMLPEALSNHLCSLKPKEDRLAMVCEMRISADGELLNHKFYPAVIHSHARLTYGEVAGLLSGEKTGRSELMPHLQELYRLFQQLLKQRKRRGAIEFDTEETRIVFGSDGKINKIVPLVRNDAHRLIEEMMLIANVSAAHLLLKAKMPALYRVHDKPDIEKLASLRDFLKSFSLRLTGGQSPTSTDYGKLLQRIEGRVDKHLIQTVMLRSLPQAIYDSTNIGHFGLAYDAYTHFTSPIRRYPDLLVHRAIKQVLSRKKASTFPYDFDTMHVLGQHCSSTERRADLATRDATDWLKCDYMMDKVGQEFDGIISDVTGFGFFVELKDIYVHGLVHITALDSDYYHYDATHHLLRGKNRQRVYRLGDPVRVLVSRVDLDERKIDFDLAI